MRSLRMLVLFGIGLGCVIEACAPSRRSGPPLAAAAPDEPARPLPTSSVSYDSLLAKLRAGDLTIDFLELRLAYAASPQYAPYDFRTDSKASMRKAFVAKDCLTALAIADSMLATNYVDIEAHILSAECKSQLGDHAKASYHGTIARELLESISTYASGRTPDSAILVISVDEEYMFLASQGLEREMQGLTTCGGHPCDALTVKDRATGKERTIYFNVGLSFGWFGRKLGSDSTARRP
jgi:hypothetical protein